MTRDSREILINETEKRPNLYAANVLLGIVAVIAIVFTLNEFDVFQVNKLLVRICFGMSAAIFLIMQLIARIPVLLAHKASKFVIIIMVLLLVLTVTVLLNIHAVLAFVLPILLAAQYRSNAVSAIALLGSCICCAAAPILSYLLDTWNLHFMTGYIETFCRVTLNTTPGNDMSTLDALYAITLYWSMPQILTLCAFGLILFSVTKSSIDSVDNQIKVVDLSNDLNRQLESIITLQERVMYSLSDIIESRDIETGGHVRRTSNIIRLLTDEMLRDPESGVTKRFCDNICISAAMHDLGKISVPDTILRKSGRLTGEEYEIIKQHPIKSAEIITHTLSGIENEELLATAVNIAKYHHERVDGLGYPEGLRGDEIPLEARIMALVDVYDALVSERCYKAPMAFEQAFETIEESMGTQFDPSLNRYFIACRKSIERYYRE